MKENSMTHPRGPGRRAVLGGLTGVLGLARPANAAYPDRVVRIVIAFPPGGPPDLFARMISPALGQLLQQSFIVDNRPGASGIVGTSFVSRAAPDGYTIMVGSIATHATNAAMFKTLPYDPVTGFTPLALLGETPIVVVANPRFPANSIAEMVAIARQGKLNFGSNSFGSTAHLSAELLMLRTGIKMTHVPFKGSSPLLVDLMSGQVMLGFDNLPSSLPFIRSGQIKVLGVTSAQRSPVLPEVQTLGESGIPDYSASAWYGVFGPPMLPKPIQERLSAAMLEILAEPTMRAKLEGQGFTVLGSGPKSLATKVEAEVKTWRTVVETNGIERQ